MSSLFSSEFSPNFAVSKAETTLWKDLEDDSGPPEQRERKEELGQESTFSGHTSNDLSTIRCHLLTAHSVMEVINR